LPSPVGSDEAGTQLGLAHYTKAGGGVIAVSHVELGLAPPIAALTLAFSQLLLLPLPLPFLFSVRRFSCLVVVVFYISSLSIEESFSRVVATYPLASCASHPSARIVVSTGDATGLQVALAL
jgi:hypothetical protein